MDGACENCGTPDDDLALVRRVYMDPAQPGRVERVEDDTELWCFACTSQYPHQPVDA